MRGNVDVFLEEKARIAKNQLLAISLSKFEMANSRLRRQNSSQYTEKLVFISITLQFVL